MKLVITQRWSGRTIFEHDIEDNTMLATVKAALEAGADLRDADLSGANLSDANLRDANLSDANLSGADLRDADLRDANLSDANLSGADLRGADLRGADLRDANLSDANLSGADLRGADLRGADLRDANLRGANLSGADLRDAYLRGADLSDANLSGANLSDADLRDADLRGAYLSDADLLPIRDDIWAVLSSAPAEVAALIDALKNGRVDGSTYEGECACLVGTIANVRGANYNSLGSLKPNSSRPAERFFMGIKRGDTPETNQFSKLALEWSQEWLSNMQKAFSVAA